MAEPNQPPAEPGLGRDFWVFFIGQSVSNLGTAVTQFALPLLVYRLSGSAVNLGIAAVMGTLPYLLFGLLIGAWVDRVDRKRLMIVTDVLRGLVLMVIPALGFADLLTVEIIYAVTFVSTTLAIAFDSAQFAVIPTLVGKRDLVTANGRIQASFSASAIAGPAIAGGLLAVIPLEAVVMADAVSFVVSTGSLLLIKRSFNPSGEEQAALTNRPSILRDVLEGLKYIWRHPVLRSISIMMALVNMVAATTGSQLVLFAQERLGATSGQTGLLFSASSVGVVALSLAAGTLRRRFSFGVAALGALMLDGLAILILGMLTSLWLALPIWALSAGLGTFFNICTGSLRQQIVPPSMLGRIIAVASVVATSATPIGTMIGGWLIERTGQVELVYAGIGILIMAIAAGFYRFSPLGQAERHLTAAQTAAPAPVPK